MRLLDIPWRSSGQHGVPIRGAGLTATGGFGFSRPTLSGKRSRIGRRYSRHPAWVSATIETSTFIIPQLVFLDPTTASAIITEALKYELLDWWVDEGPTFNLAAPANHGKKWLARVGPSGLAGDGTGHDQLVQRVIVPTTM